MLTVTFRVNYNLDAANGTVTFPTSQAGSTITADFSAYDSGTNEAEDILLCILQYDNILGGCGFDDSFVTDVFEDETLPALTLMTYQCPKNNIITDATETVVKDNGVVQESGVDFDWDTAKSGVVSFAGYGAPTTPVTCTAKYYTIQTSGITLPPISLRNRDYDTAYTCANEVVRRCPPNYILRERRDGKIEADYFTQKPSGSEDITIADDDIVLQDISDDPVYEEIATRVDSFGKANLSELPNRCLGASVTDLYTASGFEPDIVGSTWAAEIVKITDGLVTTGPAGGHGRAWSGAGEAAIDDLIAQEPDGRAIFSLDMGAEFEIDTVAINRRAQTAETVQQMVMSVWASRDGSDWFKIINAFGIVPGTTQTFSAGGGFRLEERFKDSLFQRPFTQLRIVHKRRRECRHTDFNIRVPGF